jgi:hypothetical protein
MRACDFVAALHLSGVAMSLLGGLRVMGRVTLVRICATTNIGSRTTEYKKRARRLTICARMPSHRGKRRKTPRETLRICLPRGQGDCAYCPNESCKDGEKSGELHIGVLYLPVLCFVARQRIATDGNGCGREEGSRYDMMMPNGNI